MTAPTAPQQGLPEAGPPEIDRPARQNQVKLKLEVIAGAHRGAVLLLDESDYRIGRSPDADIVLSDPGVAPAHAMLHVGRDMLRTGRAMVRVGATGADVMIGEERLPLSRGCRVKLPVSLALGEARVELSDAAAGEADRVDVRKALAAAGVVAGAAVVIAVAMLAFRPSRPADVRAPERQAFAPSVGLSVPNVSSAFALAAEEAARALNARLDAAKITTLRISAENGRLVATGTLAGQAAEWAAIQQWFDQTYNGRFVVTTRIDAPGGPRAMPALQLQAVWYGERPYVLVAGGERYFKGAILDNGWIIRDIGEDRLLLAKDGETVTLTYRLPSSEALAPEAAPAKE